MRTNIAAWVFVSLVFACGMPAVAIGCSSHGGTPPGIDAGGLPDASPLCDGCGAEAEASAPDVVPGNCGMAVAVGGAHTCAIRSDSILECWGSNSNGQLGDGTTIDHLFPTLVAQADDAGTGGYTVVAAGENHTCAMKNDGTMWCWGANENGQLGIPSPPDDLDKSKPSQVGDMSTDTLSISLGANHTCAVKKDEAGSAAWCWGSNNFGQVGDATTIDRIAPMQVIPLEESVKFVAAGLSHTCAINAKGTFCWGSNQYGQLGDGTTVDNLIPVQVQGLGTDATAIALGAGHSCALKNDGSVWCWGDNNYGQLGSGSTAMLTSPTPVKVAPLNNSKQVIAGAQHSCSVDNSGGLYCWGWNFCGQLGTGTQVDGQVNESAPVLASTAGNNVSQASASWGAHMCAVENGVVKCWGQNDHGQIGNGTTMGDICAGQTCHTTGVSSLLSCK